MPPDTKSGLRRTRNARFAGFTKRADRARCPRRHCYPTLSADGSSSRPCQSSPRWSVRMVSCLFVRRGGGVSCPGAAKKPEWAAETRRHRRDSSVAHRAKEEVSSLVAASPSRIGNADPSLRRGSWSRVAQLRSPNLPIPPSAWHGTSETNETSVLRPVRPARPVRPNWQLATLALATFPHWQHSQGYLHTLGRNVRLPQHGNGGILCGMRTNANTAAGAGQDSSTARIAPPDMELTMKAIRGIADVDAGRCATVETVRTRLLSRYEPKRVCV